MSLNVNDPAAHSEMYFFSMYSIKPLPSRDVYTRVQVSNQSACDLFDNIIQAGTK